MTPNQPSFSMIGLPLIFEMGGPPPATAHCVMHGFHLVSCDAPANGVEEARCVELDSQWFTTEPLTRTHRRNLRKGQQR